MSYPFSNLSTVVLATDIPVLPVEELGAETTSVRAILSSKNRLSDTFVKDVLFLYSTPTVLYGEAWKLLLHALLCSQHEWHECHLWRGSTHVNMVRLWQRERGLRRHSATPNTYIHPSVNSNFFSSKHSSACFIYFIQLLLTLQNLNQFK